VNPKLYTLIDLMNDKVPGYYYAEQLTKTEEPKDSDFRLVEKILKTKTINGVKYFFVKFLFYPPKFNLWIRSDNIKRGKM